MTGSPWFRAIVSALSVLFALPASFAQDPPAASASPAINTTGDAAMQRETLDYSIEWRLIPAGSAKLVWTQLPHAPVAANELQLHMESAGLVSRLFHVDDDYTAMLGPSLCTENTLLIAHEGSRNRETTVRYDPLLHKAEYSEKDLVKNTTTNNQVDIPPCVHDVIGALMMLRTLNLEPGKTAQVPVSDGKKFAQVRVDADRREDLNTPFGMRKTIRYEVFIFDNVIYKRSAHLHIWLTDDNQRLPVQVQVRLQFAIGTLTLRLEKQSRT